MRFRENKINATNQNKIPLLTKEGGQLKTA